MRHGLKAGEKSDENQAELHGAKLEVQVKRPLESKALYLEITLVVEQREQ